MFHLVNLHENRQKADVGRRPFCLEPRVLTLHGSSQPLGNTWRLLAQVMVLFVFGNISAESTNNALGVNKISPRACSLKTKPNLKQHVQFDKSRNGCSMGCCSIGCMGIIGMFVLVGVVGYYSLFHSSLPLYLFEAAIEESGEVEIEGLEGTLSSGFSADEIRFKTMDDRWSNLTDIKFKYDSDSSLFGTERLIIEEVSVNGGTIYADWDPDENELGFDPDITGEFSEEFRELDEEFAEFGEEMREEIGHSPGLRELRIDLVSVTNVKIVNPATELEITIDEMKFEGFEWQEGNLQSLGELLIRSSQVDLVTVPSVEFSEMKNARRFEGNLRAQADHRLMADVPFVFEIGVDDELEIFISSELFDGRLRFVDIPDQTSLSYIDFSPGEYIDLKDGSVLPSKITLKLDFGEDKEQGPTRVNEDGAFELGITRFDDLRIVKPDNGPSVVVATAIVEGETVRAFIEIAGPSSPWWNVSLESEGFDTTEDLWAQTLFGNAFDQLEHEQQVSVGAAIPELELVATSDEDQEVGKTDESVTTEQPVNDGDAADAEEQIQFQD